jgi:hypothetical protein
MSLKKRLVEMFERVNKVKLDESLTYAHVDSAEPTKDEFVIGIEENENPLIPPMNPSFKVATKRVYQLTVGDELSSGAKVISNPVAGLRTPSGKVEIGIEYPGGNRKLQIWGKNTTIGVKVRD